MAASNAAYRFDGRVALVTGGGSGIGRASAVAFARAGARVVVADIDSDGGEETRALVADLGGESAFVQVDISRSDEVESMVRYAVARFGRIDFAHNNAGLMMGGVPLQETDEDLWDTIIRVNLKGTWLCLKYEILQLRMQGGGAIVNTASVQGLHGQRGAAAYTASKHGVVGLTRAAARDVAAHNIRVNAVAPSWIRTPFVELFSLTTEVKTLISTMQPIGRVGEPEEVANAVIWLCSDEASFVTGHVLAVDGGFIA